jgi:hypothetical protein
MSPIILASQQIRPAGTVQVNITGAASHNLQASRAGGLLSLPDSSGIGGRYVNSYC